MRFLDLLKPNKIFGRQPRRDDTAYGGMPMPRPAAEAGQGPFKTVNKIDLDPDDIVIAYVMR